MSKPETNKAIQDFAAQVRAALAGLSNDEIHELTEGLEADLAERAADHGTSFGSAAAYAAELKAAAGLTPEPQEDSNAEIDLGKLVKTTLGRRIENLRQAMSKRIDDAPALRGTLNWLQPFIPVLWIARGYLVYFFLAYNGIISDRHSSGYLPDGPISLALFLFTQFASISLGRSKKVGSVPQLLGKLVLSVWAIMVIPSFFYSLNWAYYTGSNQVEYRIPAEGLYSGGNEVSNVFAYDTKGNPLTDVQLFDQNGKPLAVGNNYQNDNGVWYHYLSEGTENLATTPHTQSAWITGWNVFPLQQVSMDKLYNGLPLQPTAAPLPFGKANPLVLNSDQSGTGANSATAGPTAGPTSGPSANASGTATSAPNK